MGVTLGHADLGVPKQALDHVKRHTLVHQEAGERMAQIMQSEVSQACTAPDAVPRREQTGELRGKDIGARRIARRRPQQCDGRSIERNGSRFARFRHWHEQGSLLPVHILPPGSGHLTAPGSGKQQEHDGFGGDLVPVRVDRANEALGLLGGQKPLSVNLGSRGETCRRVHACARHVPLSRKIENIAQEHLANPKLKAKQARREARERALADKILALPDEALFSYLRAGVPSLVWDNIPRGLAWTAITS